MPKMKNKQEVIKIIWNFVFALPIMFRASKEEYLEVFYRSYKHKEKDV